MSSRIVPGRQAELIRFTDCNDATFVAARRIAPQAKDPERVLEELERDAFQKGLEAGRKTGQEYTEKEFASRMKQVAHSVAEVARLKAEIFEQSEREVIQLAVEIARKLIQREIAIDERIVLTFFRLAAEQVREATTIMVGINPQDAPWFEEALAGVPQPASQQKIEIVVDPKLERGECILNSDSGAVDARIEAQFREIERGLFAGF